MPAVVELAAGWRVSAGGQGELTTPTGMALLVTLAERCQDLPPLQVHGVGVGAGTRDPAGRANVTRVVLGDEVARSADPTTATLLLETNVDDLDPRLWPEILQRLLRNGADDAWLVPILGKKGRPGHVLSALCPPDRAECPAGGDAGRHQHRGAGDDVPQVRAAAGLVRRHARRPRGGGESRLRDGVIAQVSPEFDSVAAAAATLGARQHDVLTAVAAAAAAAGLVAGAALPEGAGAQ